MTNMVQVNIGKGVGTLAVDFEALKAMPAVSEYIWQYGIKQMLSDVHASITAKTEADDEKRAAAKRALSEKKLASLMRGEVAQERVGSGLDAIGKEMAGLAEADLRKRLAGIGKKRSDIDDKLWVDLVKKQIAANETAYKAKAEIIVAAKRADLAEAPVEIDLAAMLAPAPAAVETE